MRGNLSFLNEVGTTIIALATKEIAGMHEIGTLGL